MNELLDNALEHELIAIGFKGLFQLYYDNPKNKIWNSGANEEKLKNIIEQPNSSLLGSFLAAETLRYYEVKLDKKYTNKLSEAYVYALEKTNMEDDDFIGISANSWGFLYNNKNAGYLGEKLISYGEITISNLVKLLEIEGKVLYEGSEEATIGNDYQYRIKDFAAFYIAKIKNIPLTFYQDFDERDAEIERLKKILANE
ncbi:hypothetical protein H2O64_16695 [Kordia sp. YSTF-M3]|uniref:Uncharacterized protein n=1 Tax=Kordia aestuariivivens TaxID=2759037 RepID=A0ABR7QCL0_9FLAO|nr:hypothetical protein [Kordia aestuariivivens]MBC8756315.1 hypothetical protein [Kordia aestuariivivens]